MEMETSAKFIGEFLVVEKKERKSEKTERIGSDISIEIQSEDDEGTSFDGCVSSSSMYHRWASMASGEGSDDSYTILNRHSPSRRSRRSSSEEKKTSMSSNDGFLVNLGSDFQNFQTRVRQTSGDSIELSSDNSSPSLPGKKFGLKPSRNLVNDENDPPFSFSNDSGLDTDTSSTTQGSGWIGVGLRTSSTKKGAPIQYMDSGSLTNYGLPLTIIRNDEQIEEAIEKLLRHDANISHRVIFHRILRSNINARNALLKNTAKPSSLKEGNGTDESDDDTINSDQNSNESSPVIVPKTTILSDKTHLPRLTFNRVKSLAIRVRRRQRQIFLARRKMC
eukprot:g2025.t1